MSSLINEFKSLSLEQLQKEHGYALELIAILEERIDGKDNWIDYLEDKIKSLTTGKRI